MEATADPRNLPPAAPSTRMGARVALMNAYQTWVLQKIKCERPERLRVLFKLTGEGAGIKIERLSESEKQEFGELLSKQFEIFEKLGVRDKPMPKDLADLAAELSRKEQMHAHMLRRQVNPADRSGNPYSVITFLEEAGFAATSTGPQPPSGKR